MSTPGVIAVFVALSLALPAAAAPRGNAAGENDWPCQQRLVPVIAAATVWDGPSLDKIGDWRSEPAVAALVQRISPRSVDEAAGSAAIAAFVKELPSDRAARERLVTLAFAGLLEETNRERSFVINRIKELDERQQKVSALVARLTAEYDAIPSDAQGEAATRRADLERRRTYVARTFDEVRRTMRYACEAPTALDARLGAYARALQASLS